MPAPHADSFVPDDSWPPPQARLRPFVLLTIVLLLIQGGIAAYCEWTCTTYGRRGSGESQLNAWVYYREVLIAQPVCEALDKLAVLNLLYVCARLIHGMSTSMISFRRATIIAFPMAFAPLLVQQVLVWRYYDFGYA